jgi:tRNA G18 (ribose-2'-O)-methylase SpoU
VQAGTGAVREPNRDPGTGVVRVEDPSDPRLADYVGLSDMQRRRAIEAPGRLAPHGILIAEGALAVRRLTTSRFPLRSLLLAERRLVELRELVATAGGAGAPVFVADRKVLEAITGFDVHRGVLASASRLGRVSVAALASSCERLLVAEGVTDNENVGALFRNAAAFSVEGVLLDGTCADPLYRRSIRVSVGHALHVPYTRAGEWPGALDELRQMGFTVVALTPDAQAAPIGELPLPSAGRVALLVGTEGPGLTEQALARADFACRIPLAPGVDSLNVATAAAIACYELERRRQASACPGEP